MARGLNEALKLFDATEANLEKLEALWSAMQALVPTGIAFLGESNEAVAYEEKARAFTRLASEMPAVEGHKIHRVVYDQLDFIAQARLDAHEVDLIGMTQEMEAAILAPGRSLREYRFLLDEQRRELIRDAVEKLARDVDGLLGKLHSFAEGKEPNESVQSPEWELLREHGSQLVSLLGRYAPKGDIWSDFHRHLRFAQKVDFEDITKREWPALKELIFNALANGAAPIPVGVADLADVVAAKPRGPIGAGVNWSQLGDAEFEAVLFALISTTGGYENPLWLTHTNAPDRGRDLSVDRVHTDTLSGVERQRTIIQCKHWRARSVGVKDVSLARDQMKLWEPPPVDIHVIATSGRFTTDAVAVIETHNRSERMRIEMWPETHLERLLATRPDLLARFGLRPGTTGS